MSPWQAAARYTRETFAVLSRIAQNLDRIARAIEIANVLEIERVRNHRLGGHTRPEWAGYIKAHGP